MQQPQNLNVNVVNNIYQINNNPIVVNPLEKKKLVTQTQENEKINENNPLTNSNIYIQTNNHNISNNDINKPNKFTGNQNNYKFIETLNNNDRNITAQANLNTVVHLTNNDKDLKNSKMQTSFNKSLYFIYNSEL